MLCSKSKSKIKQGIRDSFKYYSQAYKNALQRSCRLKHEGYYKNGKEKLFKRYLCASCERLHKRERVEVDHIEPVGPFKGCWNSYINKIHCGTDNLQVLCKSCHKEKTRKTPKK